TQRQQRERFYVTLEDGTTVVVTRARRDEGHRAPFRAIELIHDGALRQLRGDALLEAVILDYPAIKEYRETAAGVPDDARGHLEHRIRTQGALMDEPPEWAVELRGADRPVLLLKDEAALVLQPLVNRNGGERALWRAVGCVARRR